MHSADFAKLRIREIDDRVEKLTFRLLGADGALKLRDHTEYLELVARRNELLEVRRLITDALDRDEAG